jgi:DNA-binding transcriptional LysR family regulator
MNFRHLVYFDTVARTEHVSRAASELLIAQPALSRQLREFERDLGGVRLFERVGRNVKLTEAGRLVHARVVTILKEVAAIEAEMRERADAEAGRVAIGAPPTVGLRLLPDALAEYHRAHPRVELHVREGSTRALLDMLKEGEVDLAVVSLPSTRRELAEILLFEEELQVVVARDHPYAKRSEVSFRDLADEPFLLYPDGYEIREMTLAACRQAGFEPRVVLDGGEMDMLIRLAEVGLGLALMPPLALIGVDQLAVLKISDQSLRRRMVLVSRQDHALTPVAAAMRDFLAQRLRR